MFVVEDGSGFSNANSLASVEFADAYHAERRNVGWAEMALEDKQANLIKGTDYVTGVFGAGFDGYAKLLGQALPFPRVTQRGIVGNPVAVQQAVSELALAAKAGSLINNLVRGKKRVKVGSIEVEYDGDGPMQTRFVSAFQKLVPFLKTTASNPNMARLVRV